MTLSPRPPWSLHLKVHLIRLVTKTQPSTKPRHSGVQGRDSVRSFFELGSAMAEVKRRDRKNWTSKIKTLHS